MRPVHPLSLLTLVTLAFSAFILSVTASPAFSLIDAELRYGPRWYESNLGDQKSGTAYMGYTAAAHLGILPMIDMGLGLSQFEVESRDLGTASSGTLTESAIEVFGSIPFIPLITPFARLQFPISSDLEVKVGTSTVKAELARVGDFITSVGAQFQVIPLLLSGTLEAGHGVVMTKYNNTGHDNRYAQTIQTVMLGLKIEI